MLESMKELMGFRLFRDERVLPPHASSEDKIVADNLKGHVTVLASEIGPRNTTFPTGLEQAARYVERVFSGLGYEVERLTYRTAEGHEVRNVEAVIPGEDRQSVIVGAHYDSVYDCPGANDNGSGVAGLLEIARHLAGKRFKRTVKLVAFVNEEPPYFLSQDMGSRVYANALNPEEVYGMICLETIGYYSDREGSQEIPSPLNWVYDNTRGDFALLFADPQSKDFLSDCIKACHAHVNYKVEGMAVPQSFSNIALSDNLSFWKRGIPAIIVTDTVYFRYPYYHDRRDTADKLTYEAFGSMVNGLAKAIEELAGT